VKALKTSHFGGSGGIRTHASEETGDLLLMNIIIDVTYLTSGTYTNIRRLLVITVQDVASLTMG